MVDCQPSQSKTNTSSYDKQPESATRPEQLGLGQKQDVNNHMQSASLCTQPAQVTRNMMNNHLLRAIIHGHLCSRLTKPRRLMSQGQNETIQSAIPQISACDRAITNI